VIAATVVIVAEIAEDLVEGLFREVPVFPEVLAGLAAGVDFQAVVVRVVFRLEVGRRAVVPGVFLSGEVLRVVHRGWVAVRRGTAIGAVVLVR
jgi:hypothetical protein